MISPLAAGKMVLLHDATDFVVWQHRLPRSLIAILVGAALGTAGTLIQGVIRNPLASPDILGVTQGAGLAVTVVLLLAPAGAQAWLPLIACLGGAGGALLLMAYNSGTAFSPLRFALSGVAVSMTFASVTEFLLLTYPVEINTALLALTGSLWARGWTHLAPSLLLIPLIGASFFMAKPLDLIGLGDEAATGLGVGLGRARLFAIAISVLLTGISVSVIGPVTFVGLMAPHLARRLVGGAHLTLIPTAALVGAIIVILADTLGRGLAPPMEIPVGVLTAVIGAPYFLWLLFRIR
ncbi:iron complex transport system permease protein [Rhizobium metallidurans]|uniref:Iron complex transport system permease protein n=2 Tax=Rhizobium metallidurans TaxID=1265931 RepID=A0A7W6GET5_9HYPH|nr:iron complex transport system permease protein [Rhizobium metallidurans]